MMVRNAQNNNNEIRMLLSALGLYPGLYTRTAPLSATATEPPDGLQRTAPGGASPAPDTYRWILATEQPAPVFDWARQAVVQEVLQLEGITATARQIPLLDSHNRRSAADLIGSVEVTPGSLITAGTYRALPGLVRFSEASDLARETRQKVAEGHLTDGSIGYRVLDSVWIPAGDTARVNGREYTGPLKVSTRAQIMEFSITPIGADTLAKISAT